MCGIGKKTLFILEPSDFQPDDAKEHYPFLKLVRAENIIESKGDSAQTAKWFVERILYDRSLHVAEQGEKWLQRALRYGLCALRILFFPLMLPLMLFWTVRMHYRK